MYAVTDLNNALESDRHPLPEPYDLFTELSGAHYFTHLDLSDAYLHGAIMEKAANREHVSRFVPV